MTDKLRLTRPIIDKLTPGDRQRYVYDSSVTGLCICINPTGRKVWYLYRKVNSRPVRLKLGRYPELGPEQARQLATEAAGRMAAGEDIQQQRRDKRFLDVSWSDVFSRYLEEHAKPHKKTWREDQANAKRYLSDWDDRPLSSFQRQLIAGKHLEIGDSAPTAANRVLSLVSKVFSFASHAGIWNQPNPCQGIQKFRERSRDRFVGPDEMPALLQAIANYPDDTLRDFFLLSLYLGARRRNMLEMRWEDLDLREQIWRIPETKSGQPVILPIPDEAQKILRARKKICGDSSGWVFPGRGATGHLVEPKKAWASICQTAGIAELRIHDLRRTLGSWQAAAGTSLAIIGKSLGHRTTSATQVYARLQLGPVRESVSAAVSAMVKTAKQGDQDVDCM